MLYTSGDYTELFLFSIDSITKKSFLNKIQWRLLVIWKLFEIYSNRVIIKKMLYKDNTTNTIGIVNLFDKYKEISNSEYENLHSKIELHKIRMQ